MESNSCISKIVCLCEAVALDVVDTGITFGGTCVVLFCVVSDTWHNIASVWSVASSHGL